MKENMKTLPFNGKDLPICFNLNVMEAIQKEYGTLDKWFSLTGGAADEDAEIDVHALLFGMREMLNEAGEIAAEKNNTEFKPYTHKQVGRIMTDVGLEKVLSSVQETVIESTQSNEKNG
ncbi:MAG: hypothetical protein IKO68_08240 [Oscillospiraceae bacterium]|nr:hypothetical protein [Oscillospiraceae bacterium]